MSPCPVFFISKKHFLGEHVRRYHFFFTILEFGVCVVTNLEHVVLLHMAWAQVQT